MHGLDLRGVSYQDRVHTLLLGSWKVIIATQDDFDLVMLIEYLVVGSEVETLCLTVVGYTWQWRSFYAITLLKALIGLYLRGEIGLDHGSWI